MSTGTVKWFNDAKGFGFITPDDSSSDLFAHFSQVNMTGFPRLHPGQRVVFDITNGPNGREFRLVSESPLDPVRKSSSRGHQGEVDLVPEPLLDDASAFLKAVAADLNSDRQMIASRLHKYRDEFLCVLTQITSSNAKEAM